MNVMEQVSGGMGVFCNEIGGPGVFVLLLVGGLALFILAILLTGPNEFGD